MEGGGGFFWEILTKNSDKYLFSASFVKAGKYLTVSYHRISESWGVYFSSAKVVPTYFIKHHFLSDVHCCYAIQGKSITLLKNYTLNFITLHDSRYITFFVNIVEICHGIINFLLKLTRWWWWWWWCGGGGGWVGGRRKVPALISTFEDFLAI